MSKRTEQIGERLSDFVRSEMRGEEAVRAAAGGMALVEEDGSPTPPGADLVAAMGLVYALLMLDFHQGNVRAAMEMFGQAISTALEDPKIRSRVKFLRSAPATRSIN
jgi:hypothetical protein